MIEEPVLTTKQEIAFLKAKKSTLQKELSAYHDVLTRREWNPQEKHLFYVVLEELTACSEKLKTLENKQAQKTLMKDWVQVGSWAKPEAPRPRAASQNKQDIALDDFVMVPEK